MRIVERFFAEAVNVPQTQEQLVEIVRGLPRKQVQRVVVQIVIVPKSSSLDALCAVSSSARNALCIIALRTA